MKILLLNQFFPPDLAPTGQMAADLAEDLVSAGQSVTVVTSRGDYLGGDKRDARSDWRGIEVHRVAATSLGKRTLAHRALDYSSFYASAGWKLRRLPPPDVIVAMTTPPLIAAAALGARHKGTKLVYWVQDLYPEIAVAFGAIGESALHTRAMARVSRKVMQASAKVVVLGEAMKEKAIAAGARGTVSRSSPTGQTGTWSVPSRTSRTRCAKTWPGARASSSSTRATSAGPTT